MESRGASARETAKWSLLILLAAVPLLAATSLLQLLELGAAPLSAAELAGPAGDLPKPSFIPGALTYVAVTTVHIFTCLGAMALGWLLLRDTPGWKSSALTAAVMAATICLAVLFLPVSRVHAYDLTYVTIRDFYSAVSPESSFGREGGGLSPIELAAYLRPRSVLPRSH